MSFETIIYSTKNEKEWNKLVNKSPDKDIFFSVDYLSLLEKHMKCPCFLFFYGNSDKYILCPFFKREINNLISHSFKEEVYDIISPWYYGGYIFYGDVTKKDFFNFISQFEEYCKKENIISNFTRLHPYLINKKEMISKNYLTKIGECVYVDLTKSLDYIFKNNFDKHCRNAIRKSEKVGVTIHINKKEHLKIFHKIYLHAMKAKNADKFYFFSYETLSEIRSKMKDKFLLITLENNGKIVGGSIFLFDFGKMYYFLSMRDPKHDNVNASNRIIYEAIKISKKKNLSLLDLGGGPKNLLKFKKSFSDKVKELHGYKKIYDKKKYRKICKMIGLNITKLKFENASFFPEYKKGR